MSKLRNNFEHDATEVWRSEGGQPTVLVTAVRLPSGAIETAENREFLNDKIQYILGAYDKDFKLKSNPAIEIVGYMIV
jgi:hypothetical protein